MRWIFLLCLLSCEAGIENQFRKLEHKTGCTTIQNVDFIYLINLDQRPERLEKCLSQLSRYAIFPQRFPGVYGWTLPYDALSEVGLVFNIGMDTGRDYVWKIPPDKNGNRVGAYLDRSCHGKTYFSKWTSRGAIGCTLSHLSVLQDAYDAGYQTIWVMEDDIVVNEDPHLISQFIEKLDEALGEDGWDLLFTDGASTQFDASFNLLDQMPMMWRPDFPGFDMRNLLKTEAVNEDFIRLGHRMYAHSIIYRRSGIEKILRFYKENQMFSPYDHEYFFIQDLRLFGLRKTIIGTLNDRSDTSYHYFDR